MARYLASLNPPRAIFRASAADIENLLTIAATQSSKKVWGMRTNSVPQYWTTDDFVYLINKEINVTRMLVLSLY